MQPIQQRFSVHLHYNIHFTTGLFNLDNPLLAQVIAVSGEPKRIVVAVDAGVLHYHKGLIRNLFAYVEQYSDVITLSVEPVIVPGGEAAKNDPRLLDHLHSKIHEAGLCRHSYVLAIGGGAVLDLVGYAAATAHRGIRLIRIPTTVLAQNDSGVGVKNGINAFGKKNFLGTFAPPYAVLNDFNFLTTLDERDWRSGVAEAIKVALIKDKNFFELIETQAEIIAQRDMNAMKQVIYRCAQLHLEHIATSGDPFEQGSARPLDFGHWAAHKLEQLSNYRLRHGEAVAIGIALDSTYAYLTGLLSQQEWQRILKVLQTLGFTLYVPELTGTHLSASEDLFQGLTEFREHIGGVLTLMLLKSIGQGIEVNSVDLAIYRKAIIILKLVESQQHEKITQVDKSPEAVWDAFTQIKVPAVQSLS